MAAARLAAVETTIRRAHDSTPCLMKMVEQQQKKRRKQQQPRPPRRGEEPEEAEQAPAEAAVVDGAAVAAQAEPTGWEELDMPQDVQQQAGSICA